MEKLLVVHKTINNEIKLFIKRRKCSENSDYLAILAQKLSLMIYQLIIKMVVV